MAPVFLMATAPTVDGHAPVEAVGCNWPTPVDHAEALTTMVLRDLSADLVLVQKSWRHGDAAQREAVRGLCCTTLEAAARARLLRRFTSF